MQFDSYRPELHYMRGRGPKWHAKHDLALVSPDRAVAGARDDSKCCASRRRLPGPVLASSPRGVRTPATRNADVIPDANNEARRDASLSLDRGQSAMLQTLKNWPNTTVV